MTNAKQVMNEVIAKNFNYRDQAIIYCARHKDLWAYDISERIKRYTSIFIFKDDSELRIDTENYMYLDTDYETTLMSQWGLGK
jgi:hypothetical protein